MKTNLNDLTHIPDYNDNYLRYLKTLSEETGSFSKNNIDNITSAKVTINRLDALEEHNRRVYNRIREGS